MYIVHQNPASLAARSRSINTMYLCICIRDTKADNFNTVISDRNWQTDRQRDMYNASVNVLYIHGGAQKVEHTCPRCSSSNRGQFRK